MGTAPPEALPPEALPPEVPPPAVPSLVSLVFSLSSIVVGGADMI